jgi:hypothetical protein
MSGDRPLNCVETAREARTVAARIAAPRAANVRVRSGRKTSGSAQASAETPMTTNR